MSTNRDAEREEWARRDAEYLARTQGRRSSRVPPRVRIALRMFSYTFGLLISAVVADGRGALVAWVACVVIGAGGGAIDTIYRWRRANRWLVDPAGWGATALETRIRLLVAWGCWVGFLVGLLVMATNTSRASALFVALVASSQLPSHVAWRLQRPERRAAIATAMKAAGQRPSAS